jgi:hypothetical protein
MRHDDQLDEAQVRELEELDRIFAGEAAGAESTELALLVRAVRADRPSLRPEFAAELDTRAAAGFPRAARPGRRRPAPRHWLAGVAGAAALAAVIVVAAGNLGSSRPPVGTRGDAVRAPAPESTQKQSVGAAPSGAASAGSIGITVGPPVAGGRTVERGADLALLAPHGEVQQVADRAIAATDRLGGLVESSNVNVDDHGGSQASLDLQVPGRSLEPTLAALSALAHVSARSQSTEDITDVTGAARDRLAEARAERQALLRQLAAATTANQVQSIHARIGLLDGRIAADQKQLGTLVARGRSAQVTVTIDEATQAAGGSGVVAGALDDALNVLEGSFGVLVIGLACLVPAGLLAAAAWWASRTLRRRRRAAGLVG